MFVVVKEEVRRLTDRIFAGHGSSATPADEMPFLVEFPLRGNATLGDLREFYGIDLDAPDGTTLDEFVRQSLPDGVAVGMSVRVGSIELRVRALDEGTIERVGLLVEPPESESD